MKKHCIKAIKEVKKDLKKKLKVIESKDHLSFHEQSISGSYRRSIITLSEAIKILRYRLK